MTKRILIMGLPGSGKTTLADRLHKALLPHYKGVWLNADRIREEYDDWDFSLAGRLRQAFRMYDLSTVLESQYTLIDMVCPLPEMRSIVEPDYVIWMDTISSGRYEDTNKMFVSPDHYDYRITSLNYQPLDLVGQLVTIFK